MAAPTISAATRTAANMPRVTTAGNDFFEVYYVKWNDLANRTAGWVRYSFFRGRTFTSEFGLWGIFLDQSRPGAVFAAKVTYPAHAAKLAGNRFAITTAEAGITNDRLWGTVRDRTGRTMRWDLDITSHGPTIRHIPAPLRRGPLPKFVAPDCWNVLAGEVELDGLVVPVRDAVGHQAHFWGARQVSAWTWGNCSAFREDPTFRFEGVVGFLGTGWPPLAALFFDWDGHVYEVNGLLDAALANTSRHTLERGDFVARRGHLRFEGTLRARPERMVLYRHYDPNGTPRHSHNDLAADLTIVIRRRERRRWRTVATFRAGGTAAYEVAQRTHDPRVTRMVEQNPPGVLTAV
jgi:hypothetical protein